MAYRRRAAAGVKDHRAKSMAWRIEIWRMAVGYRRKQAAAAKNGEAASGEDDQKIIVMKIKSHNSITALAKRNRAATTRVSRLRALRAVLARARLAAPPPGA
jgi:hypothetical protein